MIYDMTIKQTAWLGVMAHTQGQREMEWNTTIRASEDRVSKEYAWPAMCFRGG
jgi:predicted component of type VI protein secretion system